MHCEHGVSSYEIGENRNLHTQLTVKGINRRSQGMWSLRAYPKFFLCSKEDYIENVYA